MLKPALSRGEIQTSARPPSTSTASTSEKDGALERRFQPVIVKAPSIPEAIEIIRGLRHKYEAHHRVKITEQAIDAAVAAGRPLHHDRQLPDKAIDVIDEASSRTPPHGADASAEIKEIEKELERVIREKDMYLEAQEFEKAASLREKEKVLRHREEEMKREWEKNKGQGHPVGGRGGHRVHRLPLDRHPAVQAGGEGIGQARPHGRRAARADRRPGRRVAAVSRAIRRSRAGLKAPSGPSGRSCSSVPPAWARPSWRARSPSTSSATRTR